MTEHRTIRRVAAELVVVLGEQARNGRWVTQPSARYDCHRCGSTEGPVTGLRAVTVFVEQVRGTHAGRCHPKTT